MKLSQTGTQDIDWEAIVCRQSPMTQLIGSGIMALLFAFFPVMWWWLEAPIWVIGMCVVTALFVVPISLGEAFAAIRKTNWLLAIQADGIWVNLRSFRNRKFAPALTVVHLPWSDLTSVAATDGLAKLPGNASSVGRTAYLEIQLADHVQTDSLHQAVMEELQRRSMPKTFAGVESTGRSQHASIRLTEERRLQFAWRSSMDSITPELGEVIHELSRELEIEDAPVPAGTVISYSDTSVPESSPEQTADLHREVLELAELGQLLDAIRLYRVRTGCGLKEARDAVNNLLKAQSNDK
ncbi:MAG: hypothetical protein ABJZ55_21185 [Fuerstiella sp.]